MEYKKISYYTGLAIVIGTHLAMLPDLLPMNTYEDRRNHAIANLVGAGLIIYGAQSTM
jgi:hypothetical protein